MNLAETISVLSARAVRAQSDAKSKNGNNTPSSKAFHEGRYEAYLQCLALLSDVDVADIRRNLSPTRERKN